MTTEPKFDIIKLIEKNSITRLTKDYKSKLVNKIKENFTNNEQQIFLTSFYCYLTYNPTKDFVIDFDSVWKWCGFARKDNAKRLLEKHFTENINYCINKLAPPIGGASFENMHGGQNKDQIMLNVNTFKKFCLKANTKKADEIHNYYIKLENILQETIDEQTNELRIQLINKDKELSTKQKELREKEEENITLKKKMYERQRHRYTEGSSIYVIMNNDIKDKFKFGESKILITG